MRPRRAIGAVAVLATASLTLGLTGPAGADVPQPLVPIDVSSPQHDLHEVPFAVFGQATTGKVFFERYDGLGVVDPDGTVHALHHVVDQTARVGPDDRVWFGEGSAIHAVDVTGDDQTTAIPVPSGGVTPVPDEVSNGVDGRMWFIDRANQRIGAVATDGSGLVTWPAGGSAPPARLAPGPDGLMWFARGDGTLATITATGVVTEVATLGGTAPQSDMVAMGGFLWLVRAGALMKVAPDGKQYVVAAVDAVRGIAVANGRVWLLETGSPTLLSAPVAGAATRTPIPISYFMSFPDALDKAGFLTAITSLAPDAAGTGLLGTFGEQLWRFPLAALGADLSLSAHAVSHTGYRSIQVSVTGRKAGGGALPGPVKVALWSSDATSAYSSGRTHRVVASVTLDAHGHGTVDVPMVPSMATTQLGAGGHRVYGVAAELPAPAGRIGVSSPLVGAPDMVLGPDMTRVANLYSYLLQRQDFPYGDPVDDAGALYWARRFAAGSSRASLAATLIASKSWRQNRVITAYRAWLLRAPDAGGLAYWTRYLETHTPMQMELAIAGTVGARDARGTSSASRARHLAEGLGTNRKDSYRAQFEAGSSWTKVLRAGYPGTYAVEARALRMAIATEITNTTTTTTWEQIQAKLRANSDERVALTLVATTLQ